MITKEMMEKWIGSDNMDADSFLDLLVDIANGKYPASALKEDVLDYANQD
jgi:hypothetical protein